MTEPAGDDSQTPMDGSMSDPVADPEQIGVELFRRLEALDDRLRRSQEQMIALLDHRLRGDASGEDPFPRSVLDAPDADRPGAEGPETVLPRRSASGRELLPAREEDAEESVAAEEQMNAWFALSPNMPVEPAPPRPGVLASAPTLEGEGVASEAESSSSTESANAELGEIVPSRRPAWQSNALTVVIAVAVVAAALFLVGLL